MIQHIKLCTPREQKLKDKTYNFESHVTKAMKIVDWLLSSREHMTVQSFEINMQSLSIEIWFSIDSFYYEKYR